MATGVFLSACVATQASADISTDGSLGARGKVGLEGPDFVIGQSLGLTKGKNLFHSFERFNLRDGEIAEFTGENVSNILARVTGGASRIDGTILSQIPDANLFLINPKGIVFSRGSFVDVSGAFTATTADYVRLADGTLFSAAPGAGDALLSSAPPEAFGFLDPASASTERGVIAFEGADWFADGETLRAVAREIFVEDSTLRSPGGRIALTAVREGDVPVAPSADPLANSMGDVSIDGSDLSITGGDGGAITVRGHDVTIAGKRSDRVGINASALAGGFAAGEIDIQAAGDLAVTGGALVQSSSAGSNPGGRVQLRAGNEIRLQEGAKIVSSSLGGSSARGGEIEIEAGSMRVDGRATTISNQSNAGAAGDAGTIDIVLREDLVISNGGNIFTNTESSARGGDLSIRAGGIKVSAGSHDAVAGIQANTRGTGEGGNLTIDVSGLVALEDNGWIGAVSLGGDSGRIDLSADRIAITGAPDLGRQNGFLTGVIGITAGPNRGASVRVRAREIDLRSGGQIDSSSFWTGPGGDIEVDAGRIVADRAGSEFFTGIGSDSEVDGAAGRIAVKAGQIDLRNGAAISSSTAGAGDAGSVSVQVDDLRIDGRGAESDFVLGVNSGVQTLTKEGSAGAGGSVQVDADTIEVRRGGAISAESLGDGRSGSVDVEAQRVSVSQSGFISAKSDGSGAAGSVGIRAGDVAVESDGRIESLNSGTGDAGQVDVNSARTVVLDRGTVSVAAAAADAGTVTIAAGDSVIAHDSVITARAGGDGGGVIVRAGRLIDLSRSRLEAEADGDGGNVTVEDAEFFLMNRSTLTANAVRGDGGNIDVRTRVFLSNLSQITASSQFGADGLVRIDTEVATEGQEADREESPLDASDALQEQCTKQIPSESGSFIQSGRGGTSRLPGGYLPSFRILDPQ